MLDTDASLQDFANACVEAGPDVCALYKSDSSAVKARIDAVFANLKNRPLAVEGSGAPGSTPVDYGLVDYSVVRRLVFNFLYRPYSPGPLNATALAGALAAAEGGDGGPFWELQKARENAFLCECTSAPKPPRVADGAEVGLAVACGDGDVVGDSLEELQVHFDAVGKTSSFADMWTHRVRCS